MRDVNYWNESYFEPELIDVWGRVAELFVSESKMSGKTNPTPRYIHGAAVPHFFPVWSDVTEKTVLGHIKLEEAWAQTKKYMPVFGQDPAGREIVRGFLCEQHEKLHHGITLTEKVSALTDLTHRLVYEQGTQVDRIHDITNLVNRAVDKVRDLVQVSDTTRDAMKLQQTLIDNLHKHIENQNTLLEELKQQIKELQHNRYRGAGEMPVGSAGPQNNYRKLRRLFIEGGGK